MFGHIFKYKCKELLRDRAHVFWCLCFPIILGTMFYIAFHDLTASGNFTLIPVAVVADDSDLAAGFCAMIDGLSEPGEDQMLETRYVDEEEAQELLKNQKIDGIFYAGNKVRLVVSSDMDMSSAQLSQSILSMIVQGYQINYDAMASIGQYHPEQLETAIRVMTQDLVNYNKETTFSRGSMDESTSYFFSLIAMVCLYVSMAGCTLAINEQANLSDLGIRKQMSPIHKFVNMAAGYLATLVVEMGCVVVCLIYLQYVLKIDFGDELGYTLGGIAAGCALGVSFGLFIGSIGHLKAGMKTAILMSVSMASSFLSGLMMGNIRIYLEKACPVINHLNPASLIADTFYSLSIYSSHERYWRNMTTILVMTALCLAGVYLIRRRERYASL